MVVGAVSLNKNYYNFYSYQRCVPKNNVVSFGARYKLADDFEFANKDNIDKATKLFYGYRENSGQKGISLEKTKKYVETKVNNPEHKMLLIKDEGEYAGFLMFSKTNSTIDLHPFLIIDALYVSPEHRGKKLSKKLVQELQEYSKFNNYKGIHVKTWANNTASNNLYQGMEFNNESQKYSTYFWANNNIFNYKDKYLKD